MWNCSGGQPVDGVDAESGITAERLGARYVSPMPDVMNNTHTTDGEHYRTPGHPAIIAALGRAMWNFLNLEETVVAILYEAGQMGLSEARSLPAGGKEAELKHLLRIVEAAKESAPDVVPALATAIDAFARARKEYRNALAHAHPFTVGYDDHGAYLPGVGHTSRGRYRQLAGAPSDLHEMAHRIEDAIDPLSKARTTLASGRSAQD